MGVYPGDLVIPGDAPRDQAFAIPRFGIVAWLVTDIEDIPSSATLVVTVPPGKTTLLRQEIERGSLAATQRSSDITIFRLTASVPITNLMIWETGDIEVSFETERDVLKAGRLHINVPSRPSVPTAS